jgi:hypothetical protein
LNLTLRYAEGKPAHSKLLRMGAVRTVVALHDGSFKDLLAGPSFPSLFPEPIRTYTVPGALPRAYSVGKARALEGREALRALFDSSFEPENEVVLSGEGAAGAAATAAGGRGSVRILRLAADRELLDVELDAPGIVVSVDAWDPGWRAAVDGRSTRVLRANVGFRAVAVPAGRHVVDLRYRPPVLGFGLLLSACGLACFAWGALWLRRRRGA